MTVRIPLTLVSEANSREHWGQKARRAKQQRALTAASVLNKLGSFGALRGGGVPATTIWTITRMFPKCGREMDSDNLQRACKAVRDGIADALELDDKHLVVEYHQERSPDGQAWVEISW